MKNKKYRPSHSRIANYWKDKFISMDFEIIDHYEEGAVPVITDYGEPDCWACGMFNESIYTNKMYDELLQSDKIGKVWDLDEAKVLQRAHIIPKMLNGKNELSNYFLLCKHCHQESPDYLDSKYFFKYVYYNKTHNFEVQLEREEDLLKAIYRIAKLSKKNILTLDKSRSNLENNLYKTGFHNTNVSKYTIASAIVDGMDDLKDCALTNEDLFMIEKIYAKYGVDWEY